MKVASQIIFIPKRRQIGKTTEVQIWQWDTLTRSHLKNMLFSYLIGNSVLEQHYVKRNLKLIFFSFYFLFIMLVSAFILSVMSNVSVPTLKSKKLSSSLSLFLSLAIIQLDMLQCLAWQTKPIICLQPSFHTV